MFSVDNLAKCNSNDDECLRILYQTTIHDIGKTGISELKIPPVDPIMIRNFSVNIHDVLNYTLTDGEIKGNSDCIFENFRYVFI